MTAVRRARTAPPGTRWRSERAICARSRLPTALVDKSDIAPSTRRYGTRAGEVLSERLVVVDQLCPQFGDAVVVGFVPEVVE